jgi:anti-anti-sigma factor
MTIAITSTPSRLASGSASRGTGTFDYGGARIRAHSRHLATVVTVRGEIDAMNVEAVSEYLRRFILEETHVVLDLSEVSRFAPAGIALLHTFDEDCGAFGAEWTLVCGPAVIELLGDADKQAAFPIAPSVHTAVRNLADAIANRRQLVLPFFKKTA